MAFPLSAQRFSDRAATDTMARSGGRDHVLLAAACLMAVGVLMVATSHASLDRPLLDSSMWRTPFGRQLVFVIGGVVLMVATAHLAPRMLASRLWTRRFVVVAFILAVATLLFAFVPGLTDLQGGRHRWLRTSVAGIDIGFQPSEWAKLATLALLAYLLTREGVDPRSFRRGFAPAALVVGAIVVLVGTEDFGTCSLIAAAGGLMLLVAGCSLLHLVLVAAIGSVGMAALLIVAPYRIERLTAYLNIFETSQAGGYQPLQSLITIASGGWLGRGLGGGVQKYGYLPESHTDFIFAVVCEELGVVGAGLVILMFGALIWFGMCTMRRAGTRFERLLAFGITTMIGVQALLNMCVVTVLTPTTGISLPLISAGGSGLLTFCVAIGLLAAIDQRWALGPNGRRTQAENLEPAPC